MERQSDHQGCVDIIFFMLNMADRPLKDVRVKSGQMAINRQKIWMSSMTGTEDWWTVFIRRPDRLQ